MPEYRSSTEIGGIPLIHVAVSPEGRRGVARGWIAVGDSAFGVLIAVGGLAVGGIAVGGAGLGLLAVGGVALGGVSAGGLSIGVLAMGGMAAGVQLALGGGALSAGSAIGGAGHSLGLLDFPVPSFSAGTGQLPAGVLAQGVSAALGSPLFLLGLVFPLGVLHRLARRREEKQLSGPAP